MPIFLPFLGCTQKCIFCAQHAQTGIADVPAAVLLQRLRQQLDERIARQAPPVELGFFGGTFTCMPTEVVQECIDVVGEYRRKGAVVAARCSTRPDAVNPALLQTLRAGAFTTVELGVQSFDTGALEQAHRGYDGLCARRACQWVREAGLQVGVQLLPGMPGVQPHIFMNDVTTALASGADFLRFYPCLVISGTKLAEMWQMGTYSPWELETTIDFLAQGYALALEKSVPVIRMGLAPEKSLLPQILDGPQHPALGSMVQGLALVRAAERALQGRRVRGVSVPRSCQGFFWGHRQALRPRWAALGVGSELIHWDDTANAEHCCFSF
ncbi:MAG: radical SAM protein [Desulfovibrionaceae bacterium]